MKILFVTGLYPIEHIDTIRTMAKGNIQNASNVFQWSVVDGLHKNNAEFEVVTLPFLPAFPFKFNNLFTPKGDLLYEGDYIGKMISYCDLIVYKTYSMESELKKFILNWVERNCRNDEKLVILTYTPYIPFIKAAVSVKKKHPKIIISSIITDLVDDMMNFKSNKTFFKRIQCYQEKNKTKKLYKYIDKFILLTLPMIEKIPEALGKNIIVEGISVDKNLEVIEKNDVIKSLLYTGTLEEFSGVGHLIEAFMEIKNTNIQLIICGNGTLKEKIEKAAQLDSRIIFKGLVTREEAIKLQKQATLLINPRKPEGEITRFSFPSKTMEYLSSGTPMIGYKLEGIPHEYYSFYYVIEDNSKECLIRTIEETLSLKKEELERKAKDAFNFIQNNKTSKIQVKRVINFLDF